MKKILRYLGQFNKRTIYVYRAKIKMFHDLGITDVKLRGLQKKGTNSYDRHEPAEWSEAHISNQDFNLLKLVTENLSMIYEGATVKTPGGRIHLSGTGVTHLPDNLTVDGDMDVGSECVELPKNLTVRGNLSLSYSGISKIPKTLKVTGILDVSNSKIPRDYIIPHEAEIGGKILGLNFY